MDLYDLPGNDTLVGRRMTLAEFLSLPDPAGHELVDGVVWEKHDSPEKTRVCRRLFERLASFAGSGGLGRAFPQDTVHRCFAGDNDRKFDGSFVARGRGADAVPDLAVEVFDGDYMYGDLHDKVRGYLAAGVRLVWVVVPGHRGVQAYVRPTDPEHNGPRDTLDGGDVLPGFACRVADLFDAES